MPSSSLSGHLRSVVLGGARAPIAGSEPVYDPFFGVTGGIARYDARSLSLGEGDLVASWGDLSGSLADADQVAPARQPTYTATSLPGVLFDGSGQHLLLPGQLAFDELQPFTIICLQERILRSPSTGQLVGLGIISGGQPWGLYQLTLGRASWIAGGNQRISSSDAWGVGLGVVDLVMDGAQASSSLDGVALASPIGISDVPTQAVVPAIGAQVSSSGSVVFGLLGVVHDIAFFDRALTPSEISTYSARLRAEWGI